MDKKQCLLNEIDQLRILMEKYITEGYELTDPCVVEVSENLNANIVQFIRMQRSKE